jgi:hypothetical protein
VSEILKIEGGFVKLTVILAVILICVGAAFGIDATMEPEASEVFYGLNAGQLLPLEREVAVVRGRAGGFIAIKVKGTLEFRGGRSPVRFRSGVPLKFVIRPTASTPAVDPFTAYCLRSLDSKKKVREIVITSGYATPLGASSTVNASKGVMPLTVSRYGEHSYIYTATDLPPGEYALSNTRGGLAFCFGVN